MQAGDQLGIAIREASTPPDTKDSAPILTMDGIETAVWYHACLGDYNQNGVVDIADITPIGQHWGERSPDFPGPWPYEDVLSVIDGNSNGMIEIGDIQPIGANFLKNTLGGYSLYSSEDAGDYPEDAGSDNGDAAFVGNLKLADATGDPAVDRLKFTCIREQYYDLYHWVRPVDNDSCEGYASNLVGGTSGLNLVISLTNPPEQGSGTLADPYVADVSVDYVFMLNADIYGDVTHHEQAAYFVSNGAGSIDTADATLNIIDTFTGTFYVSAELFGESNRPDTTVYMAVLVGD